MSSLEIIIFVALAVVVAVVMTRKDNKIDHLRWEASYQKGRADVYKAAWEELEEKRLEDHDKC